jgi:hypothetical protein
MKRQLGIASGLLVALAVGIAAVAVRSAASGQAEPAYVPQARDRSGSEVVLVFIGATFCFAHRQPGFPQVIERAKLEAAARAREQGHAFRAVGIALDLQVETGLEFLSYFGRFDEIAAGGHWTADGAIKYLWREFPGRSAIPQIVVLLRELDTEQRDVLVKSERLLSRHYGVAEITDWVERGAPL